MVEGGGHEIESRFCDLLIKLRRALQSLSFRGSIFEADTQPMCITVTAAMLVIQTKKCQRLAVMFVPQIRSVSFPWETTLTRPQSYLHTNTEK